MRRKAGMGMRKPEEHMVYTHCKSTVKHVEQSKSCFSRHGKQCYERQNSKSKQVPVVVLPRNTVPAKKQKHFGFPRNSGSLCEPPIRLDRTERDEKPSQTPARDSGNQNRGRYQNRPIEKAEEMAVSTWPDISHLSVSRMEFINVLRKMAKQFKWRQKMKAPISFRNPGFWCDFHREHGHKTEDCG
ncbi:hypothetical protein F2Q70_00038635 [Brassica cretica]|uniref:Uncharacterized protein n=1 Tax=Brassica cretica TaxID=69181 RepID=A0A8S9KCH8_BRACR|nr:hypothetical protein F2Q68_00033483 [Brassica cretica]KAF2591731.1 hypothetical protein F2Q70_00038635 [Brassica cretica]